MPQQVTVNPYSPTFGKVNTPPKVTRGVLPKPIFADAALKAIDEYETETKKVKDRFGFGVAQKIGSQVKGIGQGFIGTKSVANSDPDYTPANAAGELAGYLPAGAAKVGALGLGKLKGLGMMMGGLSGPTLMKYLNLDKLTHGSLRAPIIKKLGFNPAFARHGDTLGQFLHLAENPKYSLNDWADRNPDNVLDMFPSGVENVADLINPDIKDLKQLAAALPANSAPRDSVLRGVDRVGAGDYTRETGEIIASDLNRVPMGTFHNAGFDALRYSDFGQPAWAVSAADKLINVKTGKPFGYRPGAYSKLDRNAPEPDYDDITTFGDYKPQGSSYPLFSGKTSSSISMPNPIIPKAPTKVSKEPWTGGLGEVDDLDPLNANNFGPGAFVDNTPKGNNVTSWASVVDIPGEHLMAAQYNFHTGLYEIPTPKAVNTPSKNKKVKKVEKVEKDTVIGWNEDATDSVGPWKYPNNIPIGIKAEVDHVGNVYKKISTGPTEDSLDNFLKEDYIQGPPPTQRASKIYESWADLDDVPLGVDVKFNPKTGMFEPKNDPDLESFSDYDELTLSPRSKTAPKQTVKIDNSDWEVVGDAGGTHGAKIVRNLSPASLGEKYIFKPNTNKIAVQSEEIANSFAAMVNEKTPNAIEVDKGLLQPVVMSSAGKPMKTLRELGFDSPDVVKLTQKQKDQIVQEHMVDWMVGNHDGHMGQFLVDEVTGDLYPIDKGQAFKHYMDDVLSSDYDPNAKFGEREPIYNVLMREAKKGKWKPSEKEFNDALKRVREQAENHKHWIINSLAESKFPIDYAMRQKFKQRYIDRLNNLEKDFSRVYRMPYNGVK